MYTRLAQLLGELELSHLALIDDLETLARCHDRGRPALFSHLKAVGVEVTAAPCAGPPHTHTHTRARARLPCG